MRRLAALMLVGVLAGAIGGAASQPPEPAAVSFGAVHVFVETDTEPLAAYQLELRATTGNVRIVGIEGSEHRVFAEPPYYDPAAMEGDRVIIAGFSTAPAEALPSGRTRIATIHVQVTGEVQPEYDASLTVAATVDGRAIPGRLILETEPQP